MKLSLVVLCCVCLEFAFAGTYKAAVSYANSDVTGGLLSLVYEAGRKKKLLKLQRQNVDLMVLPSDAIESEDYDENVKTLSGAAKQAGLYLVAHLKEKTRCQNKLETIRSNLVFDRQGSVLAVYRKPQSIIANCTTSPGLTTFETDFGVTFGVMMEEDLVLRKELKGLKNFVVAGAWSSELPYLSALQFSTTWSYTHNVNLVSPSGIFAGRAGVKTEPAVLAVAELKNRCDENINTPPVIDAAHIQNFPGEDLSQYIIRPLDVFAGVKGYKETVCHNSFCCEFYLKTSSKGLEDEVSYGMAVFDGIRIYGAGRYIGVQSCAVFACAGLYKRSCSFGSIKNNTNIAFNKLTISANFTAQNINYPVILSNQPLSADQFEYVTQNVGNVKSSKMTVTQVDSLLTFGVFGRVFDRDYDLYSAKENSDDFYNSIFTEDVQEFFDYLWIRVRILLFIVSIYILEMM